MVHLDPCLLAQEQISNDHDVVNDHHWHNHQPCAPDTGDLMEIRRQQWSSKTPAWTGPSDTLQSSTSAQATVTAGLLTGSTQKFQSYPNKFREVIEWAKLISQCECTTKCPFPNRATFLDLMSIECFNEAILECKGVPSGQPKFHSLPLISPTLQAIGHNITKSSVCWWVPLWHFCIYFVLKTASRLPFIATMTTTALGGADDLVLNIKIKGSWHCSPLYNLGNQFATEENLATAQDLIRGSAFVRGGVDDEVSGAQW